MKVATLDFEALGCGPRAGTAKSPFDIGQSAYYRDVAVPAPDYARSMYLPVRVSILIFSPVLMNRGACTLIPVSMMTGF